MFCLVATLPAIPCRRDRKRPGDWRLTEPANCQIGRNALVWTYGYGRRKPMNLDASLSLDVVIAILAIFGAVWRLDGRIGELRKELKGDIQRLETRIDDVHQRLETRIDRLETRIDRLEVKIDDVDRRLGEKIDEVDRRLGERIDDVDRRLGEKIDDVRLHLETRIDRVDAKVDDGNQRLARIEGRFEGREERLTAEGEAETPA